MSYEAIAKLVLDIRSTGVFGSPRSVQDMSSFGYDALHRGFQRLAEWRLR